MTNSLKSKILTSTLAAILTTGLSLNSGCTIDSKVTQTKSNDCKSNSNAISENMTAKKFSESEINAFAKQISFLDIEFYAGCIDELTADDGSSQQFLQTQFRGLNALVDHYKNCEIATYTIQKKGKFEKELFKVVYAENKEGKCDVFVQDKSRLIPKYDPVEEFQFYELKQIDHLEKMPNDNELYGLLMKYTSDGKIIL